MRDVPLWKLSELVLITGGTVIQENHLSSDDVDIFRLSIDSRDVNEGDIFVALKGSRDGHDFVVNASRAGARVALVSNIPENYDAQCSLLVVPNVLNALNKIATAARIRFRGLVLAITGSVGKTSTKEMLRVALKPFGEVHVSDKSFNNYLGVPISLANLSQNSNFAVFEIGMNRPGEIEPLSKMVRPHHVMITTTGRSHTETFQSIKEIAVEKASVVKGMNKGGKVFLCSDGELQEDILKILRQELVSVVSFGFEGKPEFRILEMSQSQTNAYFKLRMHNRTELSFRFNFSGSHYLCNSAGVISILIDLGFNIKKGSQALSNWKPLKGRGETSAIAISGFDFEKFIVLIDDSYNSNPISLTVALENFVKYENINVFGSRKLHRIAILGDMLELGEDAENEHKKLANLSFFEKIDKVYTVGKNMKQLHGALSKEQKGCWFEKTEDLLQDLAYVIRNADVILVKASNRFKFFQVIDKIKSLDKMIN